MCSNKIRIAVQKKLSRNGLKTSANACWAPLIVLCEKASIVLGIRAAS